MDDPQATNEWACPEWREQYEALVEALALGRDLPKVARLTFTSASSGEERRTA